MKRDIESNETGQDCIDVVDGTLVVTGGDDDDDDDDEDDDDVNSNEAGADVADVRRTPLRGGNGPVV